MNIYLILCNNINAFIKNVRLVNKFITNYPLLLFFPPLNRVLDFCDKVLKDEVSQKQP